MFLLTFISNWREMAHAVFSPFAALETDLTATYIDGEANGMIVVPHFTLLNAYPSPPLGPAATQTGPFSFARGEL